MKLPVRQHTIGRKHMQSMDDLDLYGEVIYELGFGRAVELGLLADYEVVVVAVEDPELRQTILDGGYVELDGLDRKVDASAVVAMIGILSAIALVGYGKYLNASRVGMTPSIVPR